MKRQLSSMLENKKGQVVSNVVAGIGGLIILVIITFVIISTLNDANLLAPTSTTTIQHGNETFVRANLTGFVLSAVNGSTGGFVINSFFKNGTQLIPNANLTLSDAGTLTNATATYYDNGTINYDYVYTIESKEKVATDSLISNFTEGIDEVSKKIPTILLIVAVVFLFGALVLLVQQSRRMGIGSGGGL